ncbi:type II secretion system protein GspG [bacterium]|nr:type II secretion system protein GspG [bacterium]
MKNRGFTMLSVIVSLALIAMFAAVLMKMHGGNSGAAGKPGKIDRAKIQAVKLNFSTIKMGMQMFYSAESRYPTTKEGLSALRKHVKMLASNDPWGNPYHYTSPGKHNKDSYDIASYGKDGKPGGTGENEDIKNY